MPLEGLVASWGAGRLVPVFFFAVSQMFGSGSAPLNFTRYADFCCRALAALFAIPATHCVDDVIVFEIMRTIMNAFVCWRAFADLCCWDVPDDEAPEA